MLHLIRGTPALSRWLFLILVLSCSILLISSTKSPFNEFQKAFYLDEKELAFIRPGLMVKIESHEIAADGTVRIRFRISDPRNAPLEREGINTPGPVTTSFILAYIPADQTAYTSYTTRLKLNPNDNTRTVQASSDTGGTYARVADGTYTYTFGTKLPAGYDRTATHTIGVYATRNLSEFSLPNSFADGVYHFVPNGSAVTKVRDIIRSETCNKCHGQLAFHGGARRSVEVCVLCHTQQTPEPISGNTTDMAVMVHKIHMGRDLPSVQAGGRYFLSGFNNTVFDYSKLAFSSPINQCVACHEPKEAHGATQADKWLTNPNRQACGSCHDNVNFATGQGHANGLPQPSDNQCRNCHIPQGELDFDASIMGAHVVARDSSLLKGVVAEIVSVDNARPGQRINVSYRLKDRSGAVIPASVLNRVALVLSGPTTDYVGPGATGYVSEDPRATATLQGDTYRYTFTAPLPADAKGTYTLGIEARRQETVLEGTVKQQTIQTGAVNQLVNFSVDGSRVAPRRQIVTDAKCNSCHSFLSLHGENRNRVSQCILCHNPVETDVARRPADRRPAESINMALMVHRIHAGRAQTRDYTIYGFGNTPHNYNEIGFPAELARCNICHVDGTWTAPAKATARINDPRGLINPVYTTTGACLGCHTSVGAASHALANTTTLGESCDACHGEGRDYAVTRVHAQ